MCGRYASFRDAQTLADAFDVEEMTDAVRDIGASWNVAPTQQVKIVVDRPAAESFAAGGPARGDTERIVRSMQAARWGLVPMWADSLAVGSKMINARSETAATKPSFRKPFRTSRCLVVADGYYEWYTAPNGHKTPFYISPSGGEPLAFAGMFSWWADPEVPPDTPGRWVLSTTILTAQGRDGLEEIHDREPVMLARAIVDAWLDPAMTDVEQVADILHTPGPELTWHPVGKAVGSVRNNSPALIAPVEAAIWGEERLL